MPVDKGRLSSNPKAPFSVGQQGIAGGDGHSIGLSKTLRGAVSDMAKRRVWNPVGGSRDPQRPIGISADAGTSPDSF